LDEVVVEAVAKLRLHAVTPLHLRVDVLTSALTSASENQDVCSVDAVAECSPVSATAVLKPNHVTMHVKTLVTTDVVADFCLVSLVCFSAITAANLLQSKLIHVVAITVAYFQAAYSPVDCLAD